MHTFGIYRQTRKTNSRTLTVAVALAIAAVVASQSVFAENIPAAADPGTQGEWSAPFDIRIVAIHSVLLQNGKVLFWQYTSGPTGGSRAGLWDPNGVLTDVSVPYNRDLFCAGEVHLADGRLMVIGGMKWHATGDIGVKQTDFFDPTTETWSPGPNMSYARWYPDVIEYSDSTVLAIGGQRNDNFGTNQLERYDPATNTFTTLPRSANNAVGLYPRTFVLPSGQVFMGGQNQDTQFFDLTTNEWSFVDNLNYGGRYSGMAVLLQGLQQVLAVGGVGADFGHATNTAEIIDFSVPTPSWQYTTPMHFPRVHANAVLLPDGTVLVVGGGQKDTYKEPVKAAELYDPQTQTWTVMASQQAPRMYHSTALLLPDGRVWSAGSDSGSLLQTTAELFSPPYLFQGPRPVITAAPRTVTYNQVFSISTPDAANIGRVVLMKLGTTTHSGDFDQRYLDLAFQAQSGTLQTRSPGDANQAPPGWYMLFIVTIDGVPSVASMVLVQ